MPTGQESGTSAPLTVDTAASAMEALLSSEEETQEKPKQIPRPKPVVEAEEAAEDEEPPEQLESEVESEEGDPETEAEVAEEGDDPDAEAEEESDPEPRKIKVKLDGVDSEVTEEEAGRGYMRTADYTRKTQAHAEKVRKFETEEVPAVRAERAQLATQLGQLSEALKSTTPAEPNWEELRAGDPAQFAASWASWQQHKDQLAQIDAAHKAALEKVANDQRSHLVQHLESEREKLVEAVPAWKNAEVAKKEKTAIFAFAQKEGYSESDLREIYDHRVLKLLRKAWLHDKAQSALPKAKAKIEAVRVATPGPTSASKKAKPTELVKAKQRLAQTGKRQDAEAAIALLIEDDDLM
jgi:hypothetical protein